MVELIIPLLVQIVVLAIVIYLILWVVGLIGLPLPAKVIQLIWVVFALIVILMIYRVLVAGGSWPLIR